LGNELGDGIRTCVTVKQRLCSTQKLFDSREFDHSSTRLVAEGKGLGSNLLHRRTSHLHVPNLVLRIASRKEAHAGLVNQHRKSGPRLNEPATLEPERWSGQVSACLRYPARATGDGHAPSNQDQSAYIADDVLCDVTVLFRLLHFSCLRLDLGVGLVVGRRIRYRLADRLPRRERDWKPHPAPGAAPFRDTRLGEQRGRVAQEPRPPSPPRPCTRPQFDA
jgi:hypothetical protein